MEQVGTHLHVTRYDCYREEMNMFEGLKKFIEENIDTIEQGDFGKLYQDAHALTNVSKLTEAFLKAGIDPLQTLTYVPENYLCETDIKEFTVPSHITRIGPAAFWACEILNKVTLPEGLVFIDEDAFSECYNLWQINFPSTLEYIKADAFAETNLHHIVLPELVAVIPQHCFESCKQLETVKLGTYTHKIKARAFAECDKLRYVQLNEGLEEIESYAFAECSSLKEIYIPESVKTIATNVFYKSPTKIICKKDSVAHAYASQNMLNFELI